MSFPPHLKKSTDLATFYLFFLTAYSGIEQYLKSGLMEAMNIEFEEFDILLGNPNTSSVIQKLRKLYALKARLPEFLPYLNCAFEQLQQLTKLRHRLVHNDVNVVEDGAIHIGMNLNRQSPVTGMPWDIFKLEDLDLARVDLDRIFQFFTAYSLDTCFPIDDTVRRHVWKPTRETWLFRYLEPVARSL